MINSSFVNLLTESALYVLFFGGSVELVLVILQVLIGKHILKIDFKYHRFNAILILLVAFLLAASGLYLFFNLI